MSLAIPVVETALFIARQLAHGAWVTVKITFLAELLVLVLSLVIALMRLSPWRALRWFATAYVELLRGISALVLLFYLFFILPLFGISLSPMTTGVIGLGLTFSAYGSEIVRAALVNVSAGQRDALRALDFGPLAALRRIILPQALKPMLPVLGNYLIGMFKETPLLAVITIPELFQAAKQVAGMSYRYTEPYTLMAVLFLIISVPTSLLFKYLERRSHV